jgi:ABC-type xylose transport system permease subunit
MERVRSILALSPLKITGLYIVLGVTWIVLTDLVAASLSPTTAVFHRLETAKWWAFIVALVLLIYVLTRYRERQHEATKLGYQTSRRTVPPLRT